MSATITIKVPEETKRNFAAATRYQKQVALRVFNETLKTPEQQLYPTAEDAEELFKRTDQYHKENNVPPIENLDELLANYKAAEQKRIAEMGEEAYIQELEAFENES